MTPHKISRMTALDIELEDLRTSSESGSSEYSDSELLSAYRQRDTYRMQPAPTWLKWRSPVLIRNLHRRDQFGQIRLPVSSRRLLQIAYPLSLVFAGVLMSWIVGLYQQYKAVDPFDTFFAHFWDDHQSSQHKPVNYPLDFFGSVLPVQCHSHNDYWRRTPLFAALGSGCISVEADVWLRSGNLYVGHTESALRENATLQSMYIDPIVAILEMMNTQHGRHDQDEPIGVFYNDPKQTLTLLVDFKTEDKGTWETLHRQLRPLREGGWLTYWNLTHRVERPITVVASGAADFDLLRSHANPFWDIFYDAPLDALESPFDDEEYYRYNPSNSYYASVKFTKAIGPILQTSVTDSQVQIIRKQIRAARERGLVPRYWGTPRWPRGFRDDVWALLLREDIGMLNVDDLRAVRKGQWGSSKRKRW